MRLSRTDLVPMMAIIGGAAFGMLAFGSFLVLWSPFDDMPAPDPVAVHFTVVDVATGVVLNGTGFSTKRDRVQYDPTKPSPNGRWVVSPSDAGAEPRVYRRAVGGPVTPGNGALRTGP